MVFKIILSLMFVAACSASNGRKSGVIGQQLEDSTSLYDAHYINSSTIFLIDEPTSRILEVDLSAMILKNSYSLSRPEVKHRTAAGANGKFVIDFSPKQVEIIKNDGSRQSAPFTFAGTPVSMAFHPESGVMAIQDDLLSVGLLILSETGDITKSWLGGSLIEKGKTILAGDIDSSARLLLAVDDMHLAVVSVESSIDASAWKSESFNTGIYRIKWIAPDQQHPHLVLITAEDSISVVDVVNKNVVDKKIMSTSNLRLVGQSKLSKPHVIVGDSTFSSMSLYYIDQNGRLATQALPPTNLLEYKTSYLDSSISELSVLTSDGESHEVVKVRLSDNLITFDQIFESEGEARLGPDLLFINKKSGLGYLEAYTLSTNGLKDLKGFNLETLRKRYDK